MSGSRLKCSASLMRSAGESILSRADGKPLKRDQPISTLKTCMSLGGIDRTIQQVSLDVISWK
ncbi:MAG: hypothetical protein CMO80_17145 [Verrucomicrobiales bacterium]|nr:hypothetical protein [Verrucomicrobiales bacterium]